MTLRTWLTSPPSVGTVITSSNLPSNDAQNATVNTGTATITISSTVQIYGLNTLKIDTPIGSSTDVRFPFITSNKVGASGVAFSYSATPSANSVAISLRNASAPGIRMYVTGTSHGSGANHIFLDGGSGGTSNISAVSAGTLTPGTVYRFEFVFDAGSSTSNGNVTVNAYDMSGTLVATNTIASGNIAAQSAITSLVVGMPGTTVAQTIYVGVVKVNDGATTEQGAYSVPNTPPVLTVPAAQNVAAGSAVSLTASATDSDGTIASYAWTILNASSSIAPTLTGASTANVTFTAPTAGHLVTLQCVATDNLGGTDTETVEVRVGASGSGAVKTLTPLSGAGIWRGDTGAYTLTGSATSAGAALADASDTTLLLSSAYTGTASKVQMRLAPLLPFGSFNVSARSLVSTLGGTTQLELYEGTTLRKTWTLDQSTTAADTALSLTSGECASITDYGNLWVGASVAT